jgi:hypothetical protein
MAELAQSGVGADHVTLPADVADVAGSDHAAMAVEAAHDPAYEPWAFVVTAVVAEVGTGSPTTDKEVRESQSGIIRFARGRQSYVEDIAEVLLAGTEDIRAEKVVHQAPDVRPLRILPLQDAVASTTKVDLLGDLLNVCQIYPVRPLPVTLGGAEAPPTLAEPCAQTRHPYRWTHEERGHDQRAIVTLLHLQVVTLADHQALVVEDLAIHKVQQTVQRTLQSVHQDPIRVSAIRGMAASAATTTTTRKKVPRPLASRPFACVPM